MSIVYFLWIGSILHLSGGLHNYWDGLQKNAGQHQLKNGDVQRLLDFQLVAPSYVFQIFLRLTVQNQLSIGQWVIVDEVIQF